MFQIDQERWKGIYEEFRVIDFIEKQARFCVLFERQAIDQYIYALDVESMLIRKVWVVKKSQDNSYQNQVADFINEISLPDSYIFLFNHHRQNLDETIEILTRTQQQDNKILITISNIQTTSVPPDILLLSTGHNNEPNIQIFIQNEFLDALQKYESAILKLYKIELLYITVNYHLQHITHKKQRSDNNLELIQKDFLRVQVEVPQSHPRNGGLKLHAIQARKELAFPHQRQQWIQRCRVCAQQAQPQVKKSIFKCLACKSIYKIKVTLCSGKCFKQFHQNPVLFLSRKRQLKP